MSDRIENPAPMILAYNNDSYGWEGKTVQTNDPGYINISNLGLNQQHQQHFYSNVEVCQGYADLPQYQQAEYIPSDQMFSGQQASDYGQFPAGNAGPQNAYPFLPNYHQSEQQDQMEANQAQFPPTKNASNGSPYWNPNMVANNQNGWQNAIYHVPHDVTIGHNSNSNGLLETNGVVLQGWEQYPLIPTEQDTRKPDSCEELKTNLPLKDQKAEEAELQTRSTQLILDFENLKQNAADAKAHFWSTVNHVRSMVLGDINLENQLAILVRQFEHEEERIARQMDSKKSEDPNVIDTEAKHDEAEKKGDVVECHICLYNWQIAYYSYEFDKQQLLLEVYQKILKSIQLIQKNVSGNNSNPRGWTTQTHDDVINEEGELLPLYSITPDALGLKSPNDLNNKMDQLTIANDQKESVSKIKIPRVDRKNKKKLKSSVARSNQNPKAPRKSANRKKDGEPYQKELDSKKLKRKQQNRKASKKLRDKNVELLGSAKFKEEEYCKTSKSMEQKNAETMKFICDYFSKLKNFNKLAEVPAEVEKIKSNAKKGKDDDDELNKLSDELARTQCAFIISEWNYENKQLLSISRGTLGSQKCRAKQARDKALYDYSVKYYEHEIKIQEEIDQCLTELAQQIPRENDAYFKLLKPGTSGT